MHSIYDLTTYCRRTTGEVPAKLVGASTTVVGSKMYLFGGRLVTERKMVSDLYVFDLETFVWEKIPAFPEDDVPRARYFHSADAWDNKLVIFGGMSNQPDSLNPEELCVLNDVRFYDIATKHWLPVTPSSAASEALAPRARYAHLSSITADRLFIIGGQDFNNTWLDDVCVYDIVGKAWVQRRDYPRHCGTYRSVAVSAQTAVRLPQGELRNSQSSSTLGQPGQRFGTDKTGKVSEPTPSESLIHLPYSAPPSEDYPNDIYLYSNYNFTDVKRELEVFTPLADTDFAIQDKSASMAGSTLPPGLRFPTGAILGTHLIIAGTYLAHSYQSFSIWDLDLLTMTWSRIDPGKAVESGSWFRGCLWAESNKFLIFGNKNGNLVDDYNRRLLSWDHVAVVDLEAFGIYQPPTLNLDITMQELGLAALEERIITDFEIICDDGRKIACSRKILEERWPWFAEQRKKFSAQAKQIASTLPATAMDVGLPEISGNPSDDDRVDPRLTPRSFHLSEPYPITLALLQYFYSCALITPLQHAPAVLSQLLILASNYKIDHLAALVKHAMHRALSSSTSVGVYEVATLCNCRSLQIRALKTVMVHTQKRPTRSKADSDSRPSGGSGGPGGGGGGSSSSKGGGGGDGSGSDMGHVSRPRGTSDARWRSLGESSSSSGYNTRSTVPMNIMATSAAANDEDKVAPLPVLARAKSHRRVRPQSIVSIRTEEEMQDLANFMSSVTSLGSSPTVDAIFQPEELPEEIPPQSSLAPPFSQSSHRDISRQTSHSSLAATSESDHYYSSDADQYLPHTSSSPFYRRPRPPRISTDSANASIPSLPSLTSSASLNSLSNFGVLPSPMPDTPLASSVDLPSSGPDYLDIIAELDRAADEGDVRTTRPSDEFNPFNFNNHDLSPTHRWPQQKSDIRWLTSDPVAPVLPNVLSSPSQEVPPSTFTHPPSSAEPSRLPSPTPTTATTTTPRSATGTSFSRILGKKKPSEDPISAEEKRQKKEEAKAKRAEAKAQKEKLRLEKLQKDISMYPMRMGGMVTLG